MGLENRSKKILPKGELLVRKAAIPNKETRPMGESRASAPVQAYASCRVPGGDTFRRNRAFFPERLFIRLFRASLSLGPQAAGTPFSTGRVHPVQIP